MAEFDWLHSGGGKPCAQCGAQMADSLEEAGWDETNTRILRPREVCEPCRTDEARAEVASRRSTSRSHRSLSTSELTSLASVLPDGRNSAAPSMKIPPLVQP